MQTCTFSPVDVTSALLCELRPRSFRLPALMFFVMYRAVKASVQGAYSDFFSPMAVSPQTPEASGDTPWTSGMWVGRGSGISSDNQPNEASQDAIKMFNIAMEKLSEATPGEKVEPLTFQLKASWDEATLKEKDMCIGKAEEVCRLVCNVIAPNDGGKSAKYDIG